MTPFGRAAFLNALGVGAPGAFFILSQLIDGIFLPVYAGPLANIRW